MQILEKLARFITDNSLFSADDSLLLGVSGGKDSMLMTFLLHQLGYNLVIAHCNFQLRGEDSDQDELLVQQFAKEKNIPFFAVRFDTASYAEENKISIQMAARELRYRWFEELCLRENCQAIAIAQHRQDNIETVFINLLRGTGLQGLQGIAPKRLPLVRPILFMSTEEIRQAVQEFHVPYRDDQSNFSTKYIRNKIRLDILPLFREINADFDSTMEENIQRFKESYTLLQEYITPLREELFIAEGNRIKIQKSKLQPHIHNLPLLYELFQPFSFDKGILQDLIQAWTTGIGSRFESKDYILLIDREYLFLQKNTPQPLIPIFIEENHTSVDINGKALRISSGENTNILKQAHIALVDADRLLFPLQIRSWQQGDRFKPLGLRGTKKVSDFFIEQKIPLLDKGNIPILVNGNGEIIWVVGYRLDNRYKITENTKKVITFVYS